MLKLFRRHSPGDFITTDKGGERDSEQGWGRVVTPGGSKSVMIRKAFSKCGTLKEGQRVRDARMQERMWNIQENPEKIRPRRLGRVSSFVRQIGHG